MRAVVLAALFSIAAASPQFSLAAELSQQLDAVFNHHAYDPKSFGPTRWLDDGKAYTTVEPSLEAAGAKDIVRYDTATGGRSILVPASRLRPAAGAAPLVVEDYYWSTDKGRLLLYTNAQKVWRAKTRGDYWTYEIASGGLRKLGGDAPLSSLMFATFSPDSRSVAYVRGNNIYVEDLATLQIRQLTNDGSADIINGTTDWVTEEELFLRNAFRWSPDSQSIAYWQFDQSGVGEFTLINDTEQEYPQLTRYRYPQPGTPNAAVRAGVVSIHGGPTQWIKLPGEARDHYIARMDWAGDSDQLILEYLNRLQNTNQVILADAHTGAVRTFFEDKNKAWVEIMDTFDWVSKNKDLLWISERDGWRHAYVVSRDTGTVRLITNFAGDLMAKLAVDDVGGWLYYLASPTDPVRNNLYRTRLDGQGAPELITPASQPGTHAYDISPDGHWAFHRYSTFNQPVAIELISLPDHKVVRRLESNEELRARVQPLIASQQTDFFEVPVSGGVRLSGYMIKPSDFDPTKKYPVLVNVYGEPASTTVHDAWGGTGRIFHSLIAERGYLIVSFDNEGTPAPKGSQWRKSVYGAVGVLSSAEQVAAIKELARERPYIDMSRVAVWGWSGGGSNTLNLMFRYPGVYSTGIAVAPVADQRHYDTIYQERYMGLPAENPHGYHDGSPINFAQGLTGHLLIVHGSGDDNVHFQGTELLINTLIKQGKPFDFMEYPNRTHAINEGAGTSFHIYSLIDRYLEDHVPPGGVSR